MPVITSVELQKREKDRFNIFLNGKFAFSLPAETLAKTGLHKDQEISQDQVAALVKEGEFSFVFNKTLKYLSFRPRSISEIEEYFKRKKIGSETAGMIKQKLIGLNLLDDQAFTEWWINQRSGSKPKGRFLIRAELVRKGIPAEMINKLLAENRSGDADLSLAEKMAERKIEKWKDLSCPEIKKKLFSSLYRAGFSSEITERIVAKLLKKE